MSRLDFMISRLTAQRALMEEAARLIADQPGPVFELGLGSGRTFDHLRQLLPTREIFAFDRAISAHPKCIPDGDHMILGEIRETLKFCGPRIPQKPAFIHIDLGSGDPTQDLITRAWLSPLIADWSHRERSSLRTGRSKGISVSCRVRPGRRNPATYCCAPNSAANAL